MKKRLFKITYLLLVCFMCALTFACKDDFEITITGEETVVVNESITLNVTTTPVQEGDYNWESSDENIATVNAGMVTGKKAGSVTIKVTINEKTAEKKVTVINVSLQAPSKLSIYKGVVIWDKIEGASSYEVVINDKVYTVNDTTYDFSSLNLESAKIKVKALGNANALDSAYSEEITYNKADDLTIDTMADELLYAFYNHNINEEKNEFPTDEAYALHQYRVENIIETTKEMISYGMTKEYLNVIIDLNENSSSISDIIKLLLSDIDYSLFLKIFRDLTKVMLKIDINDAKDNIYGQRVIKEYEETIKVLETIEDSTIDDFGKAAPKIKRIISEFMQKYLTETEEVVEIISDIFDSDEKIVIEDEYINKILTFKDHIVELFEANRFEDSESTALTILSDKLLQIVMINIENQNIDFSLDTILSKKTVTNILGYLKGINKDWIQKTITLINGINADDNEDALMYSIGYFVLDYKEYLNKHDEEFIINIGYIKTILQLQEIISFTDDKLNILVEGLSKLLNLGNDISNILYQEYDVYLNALLYLDKYNLAEYQEYDESLKTILTLIGKVTTKTKDEDVSALYDVIVTILPAFIIASDTANIEENEIYIKLISVLNNESFKKNVVDSLILIRDSYNGIYQDLVSSDVLNGLGKANLYKGISLLKKYCDIIQYLGTTENINLINEIANKALEITEIDDVNYLLNIISNTKDVDYHEELAKICTNLTNDIKLIISLTKELCKLDENSIQDSLDNLNSFEELLGVDILNVDKMIDRKSIILDEDDLVLNINKSMLCDIYLKSEKSTIYLDTMFNGIIDLTCLAPYLQDDYDKYVKDGKITIIISTRYEAFDYVMDASLFQKISHLEMKAKIENGKLIIEGMDGLSPMYSIIINYDGVIIDTYFETNEIFLAGLLNGYDYPKGMVHIDIYSRIVNMQTSIEFDINTIPQNNIINYDPETKSLVWDNQVPVTDLCFSYKQYTIKNITLNDETAISIIHLADYLGCELEYFFKYDYYEYKSQTVKIPDDIDLPIINLTKEGTKVLIDYPINFYKYDDNLSIYFDYNNEGSQLFLYSLSNDFIYPTCYNKPFDEKKTYSVYVKNNNYTLVSNVIEDYTVYYDDSLDVSFELKDNILHIGEVTSNNDLSLYNNIYILITFNGTNEFLFEPNSDVPMIDYLKYYSFNTFRYCVVTNETMGELHYADDASWNKFDYSVLMKSLPVYDAINRQVIFELDNEVLIESKLDKCTITVEISNTNNYCTFKFNDFTKPCVIDVPRYLFEGTYNISITLYLYDTGVRFTLYEETSFLSIEEGLYV